MHTLLSVGTLVSRVSSDAPDAFSPRGRFGAVYRVITYDEISEAKSQKGTPTLAER